MNLRQYHTEEQGFSLVEVLAAIVILSICSLVLTSFFTQGLSSTKHNQNKTVMIHLARNTLFYFEKQEFERLEKYFRKDANVSLSSDQCTRGGDAEIVNCDAYGNLVYDPSVLKDVLNPVINGISYSVEVTYQKDLDPDHNPYLLPVSVRVKGPGGDGKRNQTVVEGYITDEKIR